MDDPRSELTRRPPRLRAALVLSDADPDEVLDLVDRFRHVEVVG